MNSIEQSKVTRLAVSFVSILLVVPLCSAAGLPSPLDGNMYGVALFVFVAWGMTDGFLFLFGIFGKWKRASNRTK